MALPLVWRHQLFYHANLQRVYLEPKFMSNFHPSMTYFCYRRRCQRGLCCSGQKSAPFKMSPETCKTAQASFTAAAEMHLNFWSQTVQAAMCHCHSFLMVLQETKFLAFPLVLFSILKGPGMTSRGQPRCLSMRTRHLPLVWISRVPHLKLNLSYQQSLVQIPMNIHRSKDNMPVHSRKQTTK
jgi:hypothetical protein